jgi:hypothetical protein
MAPSAGFGLVACVGPDAAVLPVAAKNTDIDNTVLRYVPTAI